MYFVSPSFANPFTARTFAAFGANHMSSPDELFDRVSTAVPMESGESDS